MILAVCELVTSIISFILHLREDKFDINYDVPSRIEMETNDMIEYIWKYTDRIDLTKKEL